MKIITKRSGANMVLQATGYLNRESATLTNNELAKVIAWCRTHGLTDVEKGLVAELACRPKAKDR